MVIPARNEMFLSKTIQDILEHSELDTEIIAVLDGRWAEPGIVQHERVNVIYVPESVGQRAAGNLAVKLSKSKYIFKCDAHCSFDQGFDRKMVEAFEKTGDDVTMVPIMRNLHAFNWLCPGGHRRYQGPSGTCRECGQETTREIIWQPRAGIRSSSYSFDAEPHFQYFEDWKHRPQYLEDKKTKGLTETMSLQGSGFMMTREKYWELIGDETIGNWGNQGIQVACSTWLSGGRCIVNHNTWYAHMFRTQGLDFGFPYENNGNEVVRTKARVRKIFWSGRHPKQVKPVSWLLEKFWPVPGWTDEQLAKLKESEKK